jgi:methanogenic corrinoid protein MtbC1
VVCACFPLEDHELGLMGVALRFRHAGWRVTFLGARTPAEHLGRVVGALSPDLVALSAVSDEGEATFRATLEALLAAMPPGTRVAMGGPPALRYEAQVKALGALTVGTPTEWEALLA